MTKRYEVKIAYTVVATAYVNADSLEAATKLLANDGWDDTYGETAAPGTAMVGDVQEVG